MYNSDNFRVCFNAAGAFIRKCYKTHNYIWQLYMGMLNMFKGSKYSHPPVFMGAGFRTPMNTRILDTEVPYVTWHSICT